MSYHISFPSHSLSPSSTLSLVLISLEDWAMVRLYGVDTVKYLQGQVTYDLFSLEDHQLIFTAHCNAQGKMISNLCLFHYNGGMAYLERRSVLHLQLNALKKFAVFSKVNIVPHDQVILMGVAGLQASSELSRIFSTLPDETQPVLRHQDTTLLYFHLPSPRFILITTHIVQEQLREKLSKAQLNNSQQWLALDIEAGYPIIDITTSAYFIPQATNIQLLNGISFNKGCYIGQEVIARVQYRGTNKRALYWLEGQAERIPTVGASIEIKMGEDWRRTGTVLASCKLNDGRVWTQAILNSTVKMHSTLRVENDPISVLTPRPLPYILQQ